VFIYCFEVATEEKPKTDVKKKLAAAAGINPKTVERGAKNLIALIFGVDEKNLEDDPALRAWCRYLLTGENPAPYVILSEEEQSKES